MKSTKSPILLDGSVTGQLRKVDKNFDKRSGCITTFTCWLVSAALVLFGFSFVFMMDTHSQDYFMFWLFVIPGLIVFVIGIVFLVKGFLAKKK